ncbi:hypothetical protein [Chitinophaga sp. CB10]|uniref:hypothetical protein n=1 Tax=Chitinophaga sp. CB10 TaxID=1891659 RepID=UPI0025C27E25|nr:hypothetical protein [Chitinophaga sp. CB10]
MHKRIIALILLLAWFGQLSGRYIMLLEFYITQDYIAANLCENRDKPALHCNGKCHLRKQLNAEEKRNQDNPERRAEQKAEVLYAPAVAVMLPRPVSADLTQTFNIIATIGYPVDQPDTIFHPPAFAA